MEAGIQPRSDAGRQRLHELRYTFCVRALEQMQEKGFDLYTSLPMLSRYLGHKTSRQRINIMSYNGFWYKKETDVLYNWGRTNIMAEDASYIVVLDRVENGYGTSYYNNFPIGAVSCDVRKCTEYIDVAKSYNYEELKMYEFFVDSQAALDKLYEIKKMVLRYTK